MHIQPQPVAQAVHKVRTMGVFGYKGVHIAFQNAELHQPGNHDAHHLARNLLDGGARAEQRQRGLQRLKHDVIDFTLRGGEFTVHREGTGDVARVTLIFTARVNQHQIAVAQFTFVFGVVQNAAVFTAAYDGVIGREARAVTVKFMVNFAFKLVLEHTGTALFHGAGMRQGADFARAAHHVQLFFRLEQAHLMHHRSPVRQGGGCRQILT